MCSENQGVLKTSNKTYNNIEVSWIDLQRDKTLMLGVSHHSALSCIFLHLFHWRIVFMERAPRPCSPSPPLRLVPVWSSSSRTQYFSPRTNCCSERGDEKLIEITSSMDRSSSTLQSFFLAWACSLTKASARAWTLELFSRDVCVTSHSLAITSQPNEMRGVIT